MAEDPMYKLEHGIKDQKKANEEQPRLSQLEVDINITCKFYWNVLQLTNHYFHYAIGHAVSQQG